MDNKLDVFDSVKSQAVNDITPEILETGLDSLLTNEVLKDIPVIGLAFKSASLYQNVSEAFFVKKLLTFLFKLKEIPSDERLKFLNKLESDSQTKKAGEKLLVTLNRLDDIDKSEMIGNLFKQTILGKISYKDFSQLSHMIDNCYVQDLKQMTNKIKLNRLDESTMIRLYKVGFFNQNFSDMKRQQEIERRVRIDQNYNGIIQPKFEYKPNHFAKVFSEYAFNNNSI